jgi:hypothetical protein
LRSNAGMANRQGDVDLREAQVSAPQLELWLVLAWPTQCVYVFCVDLRINSDYFPIQH